MPSGNFMVKFANYDGKGGRDDYKSQNAFRAPARFWSLKSLHGLFPCIVPALGGGICAAN